MLDERAGFACALTVAHGVAFWGPNAVLLVARHRGWWPQYRISNTPIASRSRPAHSSSPSSSAISATSPRSRVPSTSATARATSTGRKRDEPSPELVRAAVIETAVSHWVAFPVLAYAAYPLVAGPMGMRWRGGLPSLASLVFQLLFFLAANDTASYWVHRALHHPLLYKPIHKKHHLFARSVGVAAEYTHPIDSLFNGILPLFVGPLLFAPLSARLALLLPSVFRVGDGASGHGVHVAVLVAWVAARTLETVSSHSGYQFPLSPFNWLPLCGGAEAHDFHHSHNVGNFGAVTYVWDWLCGTDAAYRRWLAKGAGSGLGSGAGRSS